MMRRSNIQDPQAYIIDLLCSYLHSEESLWLFGSRSRGDAHTYSDWDFGILAPSQISTKRMSKIRQSLAETPRNVDVIDFCTVSDTFREIAMRDAIQTN